MRTLTIIAIVGLVLSSTVDARAKRGAPEGSAAQRARERNGGVEAQFIGSWRLVSIEGSANGGLGEHPTGLIYYDDTGHMAVQIVTSDTRPTYTGAPTPEQAAKTLAGYAAYFGTYTVDPKAHTVTHHREGTLTPGEVDFVRRYEFSGDRLILSPVGTNTHLTWERIRR